jgi:anthranilate/para-aminobenzoate synthase component I
MYYFLSIIILVKTDFSVVIKSLIMQNNKFEFQVGGTIVTDSNPEEELQEIDAKAKAFKVLLGLKNVKFPHFII